MKTIEFLVKDSTLEPYNVTFAKDGNNNLNAFLHALLVKMDNTVNIGFHSFRKRKFGSK